MKITKNLEIIQNRIRIAAQKSGRDIDKIKLLAVSKGHSLDKIELISNQGIKEFGESKVQEFINKYDNFLSEVEWHMIGHLQRNKVKYLLRRPRCVLIHSVDSLSLAKEINKRAEQECLKMNILIQVNIANDDNKYGVHSSKAKELIKKISKLDNLKIKGLMTIAPYCDNQEDARPFFRGLRELSEDISKEEIPHVEMKELSMGMTNDLEVAVEEGATILRVGSGIFGERKYK